MLWSLAMQELRVLHKVDTCLMTHILSKQICVNYLSRCVADTWTNTSKRITAHVGVMLEAAKHPLCRHHSNNFPCFDKAHQHKKHRQCFSHVPSSSAPVAVEPLHQLKHGDLQMLCWELQSERRLSPNLVAEITSGLYLPAGGTVSLVCLHVCLLVH